MKNIFYKIISAFLFLLIVNCKSQKTESEQHQRQWMLVSFKNFTKDFLVKNKAQLDLSKRIPENQYKAFMGCNNMMVTIEFNKNGSLKIGDIAATEMYCKDNKGLEKSFIYEISQMKQYKMEGQFLTLSDEKGNEMKFVAADWD